MLPKVGATIEVTVRNPTKFMLVWHPKTSTFSGTVVPSYPWLDSDTFCLTSETGFVRSIVMKNVVSIRDSEGRAVELPKAGEVAPPREWTVKGSKGDTYVVGRKAGRWSCNCVAGQFKKMACRHIKSIQAQEA